MSRYRQQNPMMRAGLKFHSTLFLLATMVGSAFPTVSYAQKDLEVFNVRGKAGRGLLAIIGDMKTGNFGRPAAENHLVDGIGIKITQGKQDRERAIEIIFNGDSCGSGDQAACFALYFIKSVRGALNLEEYHRLTFDIEVTETPTDAFLLRVGGYPTRFEMDIRDQLPAPGGGWKTITIDRNAIEANSYENFSLNYVPDAFSIGTPGKAQFKLSNVRWSY